MTNQQAATKAKKLWGKSFYVRNSGHVSSQEKRDEASKRYKAARTEIETIEADIKLRLRQLDWYQELRKQQRELRKESETAQSIALFHRFSVGKSNNLFTEILGSGDTWEEAFAAVRK